MFPCRTGDDGQTHCVGDHLAGLLLQALNPEFGLICVNSHFTTIICRH
ncbi:hypothetical protein ACIBIZ_04665 [Nonomuraea spiralis]|nr:hypothetical protein [Nonomuraea sp. WAC 01424]